MDYIVKVIVVLVVLQTPVHECQPASKQPQAWQLFVKDFIDLKCSDHMSGTSENDTFEWTGNYAFETVLDDHLKIPIKTKWQNIGKLKLTCKAESPGYSPAYARFVINLNPLTLEHNDLGGGIGVRATYFLIILGVSSALSILSCTLLLVRKLRSTANTYVPKMELLSEIANNDAAGSVNNSYMQKPLRPYIISNNNGKSSSAGDMYPNAKDIFRSNIRDTHESLDKIGAADCAADEHKLMACGSGIGQPVPNQS